MKIEEIDIDLIKPYKNNPREIPIEAVETVKKSIQEFGNNQPIVIDNDNVIVVGHTRWRALKNLGKKKAFVIKKDFKKSEAIAYRIMDNRSGENAKWEKTLLKQEIEALQNDDFNLDFTGLNFDQIEKILEIQPIFNPPNNLIADINTEEIQAPMSSVKMVQLYFNTEQANSFKKMIEVLQKELNKNNTTDTVFSIVEKEYKEYKKETE
jgi:ParB-like chromosome segregation protein Spo0J